MMELTFDGKVEQRPTPEIPPERQYQAGKPFGAPQAEGGVDRSRTRVPGERSETRDPG